MIQYTLDAQVLVDDYLRQVRAYVGASPTADVNDVLRDIQEHLERELSGAAQPVSADEVRQVLARLGSPAAWVSEEEMPWWRKVILRARRGPEDWRLAYITFGLVLLGVLFGWIFCDTYRYGGNPVVAHVRQYDSRGADPAQRAYVGEDGRPIDQFEIETGRQSVSHQFNWSAFALFVAVSFITARAVLSSAGTPCRLPSGQKWLTYPSLIMVCTVLGAILLGWAPAVAGGVSFELIEHSMRMHGQLREWPARPGSPSWFQSSDSLPTLAAAAIGTLAAGVWWTALALLSRTAVGRWTQAVFRPFLDTSLRKVCMVLLIVGIVLTVIGLGAMMIVNPTDAGLSSSIR